MRWESLFADLEGQLETAEAEELRLEVADRSRREAALVALADRVRAAVGASVVVSLLGASGDGATVRGTVLDAGVDWLLLEEQPRRDVLVPLAAVAALGGLTARAEPSGSSGEVARRLDLRWALRGLVRDRAAVALVLRGGPVLAGTLDRVGADHVDLAEHPAGEPRRAGAVRQVTAVPLTAIAAVRST